MTVLVACETLLLALLVLLVAGLLRSHAEILRRLGPPEDADETSVGDREVRGETLARELEERFGRDGALPQPERRAGLRPAQDIAGLTLERDAIGIGLGEACPDTLLAFLSGGCATCLRFWDDLRDRPRPAELPAQLRIVTVTKGAERESPARLRELAPPDPPLVMSTQAWSDYRIPASPYFVFVSGGRVRGEGSAGDWSQIASLLRDAADEGHGDGIRARGGRARTLEIDRTLTAAGLHAGDPTLYPSRRLRQDGGSGPDAPAAQRKP